MERGINDFSGLNTIVNAKIMYGDIIRWPKSYWIKKMPGGGIPGKRFCNRCSVRGSGHITVIFYRDFKGLVPGKRKKVLVSVLFL